MAMPHIRLDERIVGEATVLRIFQEICDREKVRSKTAVQPRSVNDAGHRSWAWRVAIDAPVEALCFEPLEDRLGGVVDGKGVGGWKVDHVTRRRSCVEERAVGERLRRYFAKPMVE